MSSKHTHSNPDGFWATDKMRSRCQRCGVWRRVYYVCNIEGCKAKKVDVKMCNCTLKGLK